MAKKKIHDGKNMKTETEGNVHKKMLNQEQYIKLKHTIT